MAVDDDHVSKLLRDFWRTTFSSLLRDWLKQLTKHSTISHIYWAKMQLDPHNVYSSIIKSSILVLCYFYNKWNFNVHAQCTSPVFFLRLFSGITLVLQHLLSEKLLSDFQAF